MAERLHALGLGETGIDAAQGLEAADHQPGARPAAPAPAPAAPRPGPAAIAAARASRLAPRPPAASVVEPRAAACRTIGMSPKTSPESERDRQREAERRPGRSAISWSRGRFAGPIATSARTPAAASSDCRAAPPSERQHQALDQELPRDPRPARAQGGANRQLLAAAFGPHQQQVGDVGAGQQQDDADRAHQHPERRRRRRRRRRGSSGCSAGAHRARTSGLVPERSNQTWSTRTTSALACAGVTPGLQPGHAEQPERRNRRSGIEPQRQDDLELAGEAEAGRHHADDSAAGGRRR